MKSFIISIAIIGGLVLVFWSAGRYIFKKLELQEKEVAFALTDGRGETAEQKLILGGIKKSIRNNMIMLAAGGFLLFVIISDLNKPKNKFYKKTSNQL